jgi:putative transcriptional regulator
MGINVLVLGKHFFRARGWSRICVRKFAARPCVLGKSEDLKRKARFLRALHAKMRPELIFKSKRRCPDWKAVFGINADTPDYPCAPFSCIVFSGILCVIMEGGYLTGHFLISNLNLVDPNFFRTVVLMVRHNEEGAFGLVVNRPAEHTLGTVLPKVTGGDSLNIPVYIGGPVQQDFLFTLHTCFPAKDFSVSGVAEASSYIKSPASIEIAPGVVFEPATHDLIRYLVEEWDETPPEDRPRIRLYAGYSGWAANQLERELREYAWFTHKAKPDIVFHPSPEDAWKAALSDKGEYYKFVADTGYIPSVN